MKPYGTELPYTDRRHEHRSPGRRIAHRRCLRAERKHARQQSRALVGAELVHDESLATTREIVDRGARVLMSLFWYPPGVYEAELAKREAQPGPCYDDDCPSCNGWDPDDCSLDDWLDKWEAMRRARDIGMSYPEDLP